jgi:uncharacterized membrane protein
MFHALSGQPARDRLKRAVHRVESVSAAEIAVAIRDHADLHRGADWLAGAGLAFVVLLVMLFAPPIFTPVWIAIDTALAFALGVALTRTWTPIKRALLTGAQRDEAVTRAAASIFLELGVDTTRDRSGILILVARLEGRVLAVADRGIVRRIGDEGWTRLRQALAATSGAIDDGNEGIERIAAAIEAMADPLAAALPRRPDDTNELEDVA